MLSNVLSALGQIRYRPGLVLLRRCLAHPDDRCRANAVEAIGRLEVEEELPEMIPMLDDRHHRVRANATVALRSLAETRAMGALERLAESSDRMSQRASVYALGQIGNPQTVVLLGTDHLDTRIKLWRDCDGLHDRTQSLSRTERPLLSQARIVGSRTRTGRTAT